MSNEVATKYPIVIAPHWGSTGESYSGIVKKLCAKGIDIRYPTYKIAYAGSERRAEELKDFILRHFIDNPEYQREWHSKYPNEQLKINIIAHSQGCLYSRHMISNLDMGPHVASWTGLAGPMRGTPLADFALRFRILFPLFSKDFKDSVESISEKYVQNEFRADDVTDVRYQSWSAIVNRVYWKWWKEYILWLIMKLKGYDNDIWVPTESQWHGCRRETLGKDCYYGVHHMAFLGPWHTYNPCFDAEQFWIDIITELKRDDC